MEELSSDGNSCLSRNTGTGRKSALAKETSEIVATYRKIIVLMNGAGTMDPSVEDGIKRNAQLEKLREEIRKEAAQNAELKKQLAAAESALHQGQQSGQSGATSGAGASGTEFAAKDVPETINDEGMRLHKVKKYS